MKQVSFPTCSEYFVQNYFHLIIVCTSLRRTQILNYAVQNVIAGSCSRFEWACCVCHYNSTCNAVSHLKTSIKQRYISCELFFSLKSSSYPESLSLRVLQLRRVFIYLHKTINLKHKFPYFIFQPMQISISIPQYILTVTDNFKYSLKRNLKFESFIILVFIS